MARADAREAHSTLTSSQVGDVHLTRQVQQKADLCICVVYVIPSLVTSYLTSEISTCRFKLSNELVC